MASEWYRGDDTEDRKYFVSSVWGPAGMGSYNDNNRVTVYNHYCRPERLPDHTAQRQQQMVSLFQRINQKQDGKITLSELEEHYAGSFVTKIQIEDIVRDTADASGVITMDSFIRNIERFEMPHRTLPEGHPFRNVINTERRWKQITERVREGLRKTGVVLLNLYDPDMGYAFCGAFTIVIFKETAWSVPLASWLDTLEKTQEQFSTYERSMGATSGRTSVGLFCKSRHRWYETVDEAGENGITDVLRRQVEDPHRVIPDPPPSAVAKHGHL